MNGRRAVALLAPTVVVITVLAGCSSSSSGSATSTSASATGAACTDASIATGIPAKTSLDRWGCAKFTSGFPATTRIAAANVTKEDDSHEIVWLQATEQSSGNFTAWTSTDGKPLCAAGNLSPGLKVFCNGVIPDPKPKPTSTSSPLPTPSPTKTYSGPPDSLCSQEVIQKFLREEIDGGGSLKVTQIDCKRYSVTNDQGVVFNGMAAGASTQGGPSGVGPNKDWNYVLSADDDGDATGPNSWYWLVRSCPINAASGIPNEIRSGFCEQPTP